MFDGTTNECKLFSGSLNDLKSVCSEFGYQREPNYETCDAVFNPDFVNGCYVNRKMKYGFVSYIWKFLIDIIFDFL